MAKSHDNDRIASDAVIEQAYDWLCARRRNYSANNDVWLFRWKWAVTKPQLQADLCAGDYRFKAVDRYRGAGRVTDLWSARDANGLKACRPDQLGQVRTQVTHGYGGQAVPKGVSVSRV